MDETVKQSEQRGKQILNFLQQHKGNDLFAEQADWLPLGQELDVRELCLFRLQELTFEEKAPRREAMENILGMFRGIDGVSFIYLILGDKEGVSFYFGVARDQESKLGNISINTLGNHVLQSGIQGNFRGCKVEQIKDNSEKWRILQKIRSHHQAGMLLGVPGTEEVNKDQETFQGIDRLIDVMAEDEFGFMIIARPYTEVEMDEVEQQLIDLADTLSPLTHHTLQQVSMDSSRTMSSENKTTSEQKGESVHETNGTSKTSADSKLHTQQDHYGNQQSDTSNRMATNNSNDSHTSTYNHSDDHRTGKNTIKHSGSSSNSTDTQTSNDENSSTSEGGNNSVSSSYGTQHQTSYAFSHTVSYTESANSQTSSNTSISQSKSTDTVNSTSTANANSLQREKGASLSYQEQMEIEVKAAMQWSKYLDEVLLPRLDYGRGKGLFLSCGYLFTKDTAMLCRLANTAISLFSGPKGNRAALRFHAFGNNEGDQRCEKSLQNLQIPHRRINFDMPVACATGLSLESKGEVISGGNWLSAKELSIIAGLPQKEVTGLALREEVDFGLNVQPIKEKEDRIELGHLVQNGLEREQLPVYLDRKALDKHTFVTGVTGSGKTTTCQNILLDCDLPFLVIEPAKTEYRTLTKKLSDVVYFTPGLQDVAPFFLNPFELSPGETIASRADMIKATFTASFQMEAAIPQILETAVYRAYEDKDWDINTNIWQPDGEEQDPYAEGSYAFPTMADYRAAAMEVCQDANFGQRLQDEYIGSIKARLDSLLVGAKGLMLNTPRSVDFADLVHRKVVIELEEIKNGAEKSLLMGLILTNLMQAVKKCHQENPNFQHITLIEEAHRLLSRYVPGDSMNKKQGVEVFADMLAEVRKYGESFIIADQIPDKMTPEVLKNTNTKIVHKLFARDDKDAIGDTMALDDDQKSFLSKLPVGRVVMFSQGWEKAIQVKIKKPDADIETTGNKEVDPQVIHERSLQYYVQPQVVQRGVLTGIEQLPVDCNEQIVAEYLQMMLLGKKVQQSYENVAKKLLFGEMDTKNLDQNLKQKLVNLEQKKHISPAVWQTWLFTHVYSNKGKQEKEAFVTLMQELMQAETREDLKMFMTKWQSALNGDLGLPVK